MIVIRIYCTNCRNSWEIYSQGLEAPGANICPFCGEELDRTIWERDVLQAWYAVNECNVEIAKDARGYNKPSFSVAFLHRNDKR